VTSPPQLALALLRTACPLCGRAWPAALVSDDRLDLEILGRLPTLEFAAALACWTGTCGRNHG
jgi:hypothetical protein